MLNLNDNLLSQKKTNTYSMYKSKTINFVKLTILLY